MVEFNLMSADTPHHSPAMFACEFVQVIGAHRFQDVQLGRVGDEALRLRRQNVRDLCFHRSEAGRDHEFNVLYYDVRAVHFSARRRLAAWAAASVCDLASGRVPVLLSGSVTVRAHLVFP
jgi:hypothetical protein